MQKSEMQRLLKVEDRINQIATEFGLDYVDIAWDIIPDQKMLEIMAYHLPGQISNWKYGRNYERLRTIHEKVSSGLPYEVVINSEPSRAYLMKSNPFAVQCLVMAHVVGHVSFFTMNKYFQNTRKDIVEYMMRASERLSEYEKKYGIEEVEAIVDAGHALQFHSSPFDNETEEEQREKLFKYHKQDAHDKAPKSKFGDLSDSNESKVDEDIQLYNQKLYRKLRMMTPVKPTADILRYVIDNSPILEDWHKDILEILRQEGRYLWPQMKTKYMNEGFATYIHQMIMNKLFDEKLLSTSDHAYYNVSNSYVKARSMGAMNPYLIGYGMWSDIVERWDKGQHGMEYENCRNALEKERWDTKDMKGHEKMLQIVRSHTDWFFMQEYLTAELVKKLQLYIYVMQETYDEIKVVVTKHKAQQIRDLIINTFSQSQIPSVDVVNGNFNNSRELYLKHKWAGADLDKKYSEETLKHLYRIWGSTVYLETQEDNTKIVMKCSNTADPARPALGSAPQPLTI